MSRADEKQTDPAARAVPASEEDRAEEILEVLVRLFFQARRQFQRIKERFGVTASQLGVLRVLHRHPDISQTDLSRRMFLTPSTVSGIVDRLVRTGYLDRERSSEDRRVVNTRLTERGLALVHAAPSSKFGDMKRAITELTPADQVALLTALQKLVRRMEELEERRVEAS